MPGAPGTLEAALLRYLGLLPSCSRQADNSHRPQTPAFKPAPFSEIPICPDALTVGHWSGPQHVHVSRAGPAALWPGQPPPEGAGLSGLNYPSRGA